METWLQFRRTWNSRTRKCILQAAFTYDRLIVLKFKTHKRLTFLSNCSIADLITKTPIKIAGLLYVWAVRVKQNFTRRTHVDVILIAS
jgi:hypothetical protein